MPKFVLDPCVEDELWAFGISSPKIIPMQRRASSKRPTMTFKTLAAKPSFLRSEMETLERKMFNVEI